MINEVINQQIVSLWNKYYKDNQEAYAPLFYDIFSGNSILFVGMNPSFSIKGFTSMFKGSQFETIKPTEFLKWTNISSHTDLIDQCVAMDKHAYTNYSLYFGKPIEIAKAVNLPWDHIDLFLYRETSQTNFMKRIIENGKLNQFALDQLALFKTTLLAVNPKCVVVSNAFGSEIVREYLKTDLQWDEEKGFHWFTNGDIKVPMFFTSMLSGQRSLDRWSYERLVWHIKQAIKG